MQYIYILSQCAAALFRHLAMTFEVCMTRRSFCFVFCSYV